MARLAAAHPVEILRHFEEKANSIPNRLPRADDDDGESWRGIGFRLNDCLLVAPIVEVREVLPYPKVHRLPGAKPWITGIANVRGRLVTIVDTKQLVGSFVTKLQKSTRVLLVEHGEIVVGLIVDEVLGIKVFYDDDVHGSNVPEQFGWLQSCVSGCFKDDNVEWGSCSLQAILNSSEFTNVAA